MKVIIINAPWTKPGFYGVRAGSRWPHYERWESRYMPFPFFMAYAAAVIEREGFEVELLDAVAERLDDARFEARLREAMPDFILFEVSTPSITVDIEIAARARQWFGDGTKIAFAGPHEEMFNAGFLDKVPPLDFVLMGEYEFILLELLQNLRDNNSLDGVKGLIYKDSRGNAVSNPRRPLEKNLERFPWPARHLLPMDKYNDLPGGIPHPSLQMWASRGCPFKCVFCAWPQIMYGGSTYRVRKPEGVVEEIVHCVEKHGMKSVYFDDDTFNIGKKRILKLASLMKGSGLNLPWAIMARADTMTPEMLGAMKEAGLVALKYGVESANQHLLDAAHKNLNLEKVKQAIKFTKSMGVAIHLTFMFGLPGETEETARRTIDFAMEMEPDSAQFSIATPYPGSDYFYMLDELGYLTSRNYEEYDGSNKAVIRTEALTSEQLESLAREASKRWATHTLRRALLKKPWKGLLYAIKHPTLVPGKVRQALGWSM